MVRLQLNMVSIYGRRVSEFLRSNQSELNRQCSCPPGEFCTVEVNELAGRRFHAIVHRPRPIVVEKQGWRPIATIVGMYRTLFEKRTSARRIVEEVAAIVAAPIEAKSAVPAVPSEDLTFLVVDVATLSKAVAVVYGCQMCSPFAENPFARVLDRMTGNTAGTTQYILATGSAKCPRCSRALESHTLVEDEN
jgi:hypothetical protein